MFKADQNVLLMCKYLHNQGLPSYKYFPLRTSIIPCYTTIDLTSLVGVILEQRINVEYIDDEVIDWCYPGARYAKKEIHENGQGQQTYTSRGTILTDGAGVSVMNSWPDASREVEQ
jgi:hypothetical protein